MNLRLIAFQQTQRLKQRFNLVKHSGCVVLLYHRVLDTDYDPYGLCVRPINFHNQLNYLKQKYIFIDIDEFCYTIEHGKKFPPQAILISFDDGYWDNSTNALPILESLNLNAIFYLATRQLNYEELFWWDELDLRFNQLTAEPSEMKQLMSQYHSDSIQQLFWLYYEACKTARSVEIRNDLLAKLYTKPLDSGIVEQYRYMNKRELNYMIESKYATIGAHTVNHLSLGHISEQTQRNEIKNSVSDLELATGIHMDHFSFPFGGINNYNEDTLNICREIGFRSVAAVGHGIINETSSKIAFPRFVVTDIPSEMLHQQLKTLFQ